MERDKGNLSNQDYVITGISIIPNRYLDSCAAELTRSCPWEDSEFVERFFRQVRGVGLLTQYFNSRLCLSYCPKAEAALKDTQERIEKEESQSLVPRSLMQ